MLDVSSICTASMEKLGYKSIYLFRNNLHAIKIDSHHSTAPMSSQNEYLHTVLFNQDTLIVNKRMF